MEFFVPAPFDTGSGCPVGTGDPGLLTRQACAGDDIARIPAAAPALIQAALLPGRPQSERMTIAAPASRREKTA
jgi:hypothetical protein